ncbi:hypothetical protein PIROE2DRAFT_10438 [Piromyces sp. E2]|nr:hypothetical protein PIROE2DRAFT_10438 [Piromyces sp. E2]|eukprot:OUM63125.1 hypothetical protein PIROE2DRAFT_10438 [Piromyces sp. E2]
MDLLFYNLKNCEYDYDIEDMYYYKHCLSYALFGKSNILNNIPESYNIYIDNLYKASSLSDDEDIYSVELKKVYFDFILSLLKLSANDEKYNNLYKVIMNSLLIYKNVVYDDIKNGKIDISKIDDIDYVSIAQELFYKDLFMDFSKNFGEINYKGKDFFKLNSKYYNENLFLKTINERFFNNEYTIEQVGFLIKNNNSYNMQGIYLIDNDSNNIGSTNFTQNFNKTEIYKLNEFLWIIKHPIIKFEYEKDKENNRISVTSKIDANSIYENSKSLSESIYHLIYDYYDLIYNFNHDDTTSSSGGGNNYKYIYYVDNEKLIYDIINGNTLDILINSNFYDSVYSTMITIEKNNKINNPYIKESIKLVNKLYNYYAFNINLDKIEKKKIMQKIDDTNEIKYQTDIAVGYDTIFKENTYRYLIDNESNYQLYLPQFKEYLKNMCISYHSHNDYIKALSAIDLEDYFNVNVVESNENLYISSYCNNDYGTIHTNWEKSIESNLNGVIDKINISEYVDDVVESILIRNLISGDLNKGILKNIDNGINILKKRKENTNQSNLLNIEIKNDMYGVFLKNNKSKEIIQMMIKRDSKSGCKDFKSCKNDIKEKIVNRLEKKEYEYKRIIKKINVDSLPSKINLKNYFSVVSEDVSTYVQVPEEIKSIVRKEDNKILDLKGIFFVNGSHLQLMQLMDNEEKFVEINRNIKLYNTFHAQSCRNPEIQFLRLAKDYNRIIGDHHNPHPELKISITGEVFDSQEGYTSEIKYNIIEKPEELEQVKKEFENHIIEMFSSYIIIKYKGKEITENELYLEIQKEVNEFKEKLAYALSRETIFAKDIAAISKKYLDNSKSYDPEMYCTIEDILTRPILIERGFEQMINQMNDKYFKNYKMNNNVDDSYLNGTTKPIKNDLDNLSSIQRNSIRNILYESPIYLRNIKYFEDRYDSLKEDGRYLRSYVLTEIEPIVKNCNNILENKNVDGYIIVPKIYFDKNTNKERTIDSEKEKIYYINGTNNNMVEAPKEEMIFIREGEKLNDNEKYFKKDEYILPKGIKSAYVISNEEIKEKNLEIGESICVIYDDFKVEIIKFSKKKILDIDIKKSYKLHKCDEVDVNFAKIKNSNFEMYSRNEKTKNEYLEINENGKVYFNNDESVISFTFGEYGNKNENVCTKKINKKESYDEKQLSFINTEIEKAAGRKRNIFNRWKVEERSRKIFHINILKKGKY